MNSKPIIKSFAYKTSVMKFEQWTDPDNPPKDVKLIKKGVGEFNRQPCKVGDWFYKRKSQLENIVMISNKEFKENFVEVIGKIPKEKLTQPVHRAEGHGGTAMLGKITFERMVNE